MKKIFTMVDGSIVAVIEETWMWDNCTPIKFLYKKELQLNPPSLIIFYLYRVSVHLNMSNFYKFQMFLLKN